MKKRFFYIAFVLLLFMLSMSIAQEIQYTNQITIAWDPMTSLADGSPIPAKDVIIYEIFKGDQLIGETSELQYTVTFDQEGEYRVGVRTKRQVASTGDIVYSEINYSDQNGDSTPNPFVVRFLIPVQTVANLRSQ
jgi:hypothetical protein